MTHQATDTAVLTMLPALPELVLLGAALVLLLAGALGQGTCGARWISRATGVVLVVALAILPLTGEGRNGAFGGLFVMDAFGVFMKTLILLSSIFTLIMARTYLDKLREHRFEFPILVLFASAGMMMMVSANDLMALYVALELQSLALYVLAAYLRDSARSTEAGLKYFVLGAVGSGMLLYGASLIYGYTGATHFPAIAEALHGGAEHPALGVVIGIVFVLAGLAFKVSGAPFHMWTPDVYEGAPTPVTAFFAAGPKLAAMGLFLRVMMEPFGPVADQWTQVVWLVSALSMLVGAFAAIAQTNIKRLMAYSSIGHVGYALVGLAAGTPEGVRGVLIYMAIYIFMTVGAFAVILCMRQKDQMVERIEDLSGLARTHPMMALAMALFMFSMAGIPPLAGFFGKLYVFMAAVETGNHALAIIGVLTSVVAAFYYIRIVKVMYFDAPVEPLDRPIGGDMGLIMGVTAVVVTLFFAVPGPVVSGAQVAAAALMAG